MLIFQLTVIAAVILSVVGDELLLMQAAWRHGDRSPYDTCKGDPTQEKDWPQGWGQLTARGMAQLVTLGKITYNRYVKELKFLSDHYDASEIFVRSTDQNRTLMSAISNFVGFYFNRTWTQRLGIDYPNITDWPKYFVPVPVHTVQYGTDHIGNVYAHCPRRNWLWSIVQKTPEWEAVKERFARISEALNAACKQTINLGNIWIYANTFYCDKVHGFKIPINDSVYDQLEQLDGIMDNYGNGLNLQPYDGIDFKHELGKVRGGPILWAILDHFDLKLYCMEPANRDSPHCTWMKNFKYYAYSVHDTTLGALMSAMDAKQKILPGTERPKYSSALLFELWNTTNGPGLKAYFHRNYSEIPLENVTHLLDGCANNMRGDYCDYQKFRTDAIAYYPGNINQLCQDTTSKSTSFNPGVPQSTPQSTSRTTSTNPSVTPKPKTASTIVTGPIAALTLLSLQILIR